MPLSLHAAIIATWLQVLGAARGWLDKAGQSGIAEVELLEARLIDDMLPFAYQVKQIANHSRGAIEGLREGVFRPKFGEPLPTSFAQLRERLDEATSVLEGLSVEELEGFIGQPMIFEIRERRLEFTGEDFLLSFSQPNVFFHATTVYGILRHKGVPLGKTDYLGAIRLQRG